MVNLTGPFFFYKICQGFPGYKSVCRSSFHLNLQAPQFLRSRSYDCHKSFFYARSSKKWFLWNMKLLSFSSFRFDIKCDLGWREIFAWWCAFLVPFRWCFLIRALNEWNFIKNIVSLQRRAVRIGTQMMTFSLFLFYSLQYHLTLCLG